MILLSLRHDYCAEGELPEKNGGTEPWVQYAAPRALGVRTLFLHCTCRSADRLCKV
jgi:hypothetical protein